MKPDIHRWIHTIPLQDVEDESLSHTNHGNANPCICCGKEIKNVRYFVHLLTDGNLISSDQDFDNSQGFFPIGSECKNRLPNNFVFPNQKSKL